MRTFAKVLSLVAIAASLTHCKSPGVSSVKGDDDIAVSGPATQTTWSSRMGMTFQDGTDGVTIDSVERANFASVIGLVKGDVIVGLNNKAVKSSSDFEAVCNQFAGGKVADWDGLWTFKVSRGGKTRTVQRPSGYDCDPYVLAECGPFDGKG